VNTISQQEFVALFDNAAMGIITVNPKGEIVMINNFALQQFGYEKEEIIGRKIEALIPTRYRERHVQNRDNYLQHNPHNRPMGVGMDLSALRKNGTEFPVEVSLSTYRTKDGVFSIAFITDITVRKASENALLRLNEELERKVDARTQSLSEALEREKELGELKSRFVSMASHEFRTPLSTILSSAYLVSKYQTGEEQPKRDKHIQRIVSSVNMLTDILNDFLSVGKIEEGRIQVRPAPITIHSWMELVVSELETVMKPGQRIQYVHEGDDEVTLDPSLLKHIVQNLVSNAIKFSDDGATIELHTSLHGGTFTLSVSDKGIGIPLEDQQHLFERFFRGGNVENIQGTGLGLHIVDKYASLMQGTVKCNSIPGEGTTFTVTLKPQNAD
jgi:PAS domain S-box-containing protein